MSNLILSIALAGGNALAGGESRVPSPESGDSVNSGALNISGTLNRPPKDEIIYFIMPDRFSDGDPSNNTGGIEGGPDEHGFNPTHKGFYHGGDLAGLKDKLDYIQGLGVTAIWLAPVFANKPVQGPPQAHTAGYHGYWITDFTRIDPHLGTNEEFKELVEAAHARGMKVIMDIVTNHTADVIQYRECVDNDLPLGTSDQECPYRSIEDYPWTTRGGPDGEPLNESFVHPGAGEGGVSDPGEENFARLTDPRWAYTPFVPDHEADIKVPAWLNDPIYYHNRGNSHWEGESVLYGDFAGLDDLFTEHPRVVEGMIEIYKRWISEYRVDGFRVDTVKHVNDDFWLEFVPSIVDHARAEGIEHFYVFGETNELNPKALSRHTHEAGFPAVLDFAFQQTLRQVIVEGAPPARLATLFEQDHLYSGGPRAANRLPTFTGNHDMGRIGHFLLERHGQDADDDKMLARAIVAHALMIFARGVPVIYYGDEQGFTGHGGDQDARQDMFPSRVDSYNDNHLVGATATTAGDNFDTGHPLYREIAGMAALYHGHPGLRRGRQVVRLAGERPGLFAFSRIDDQNGQEYLVVFNTATQSRRGTIPVDYERPWKKLAGSGPETAGTKDDTIRLQLPGLSYAVFKASGQGE